MSTTSLRILVPRGLATRESVQSTAVLLGTSLPSILAGYGPTPAVQLCVDTLLDSNTQKPLHPLGSEALSEKEEQELVRLHTKCQTEAMLLHLTGPQYLAIRYQADSESILHASDKATS